MLKSVSPFSVETLNGNCCHTRRLLILLLLVIRRLVFSFLEKQLEQTAPAKCYDNHKSCLKNKHKKMIGVLVKSILYGFRDLLHTSTYFCLHLIFETLH